jgi:hypothetical protein
MTILRVLFAKSYKLWKAGERYLVDEAEAVDALDAGVLDLKYEVPEQSPAPTDEDVARVDERFASAFELQMNAAAAAGDLVGEIVAPPSEEELAAETLRAGRGDDLPAAPPAALELELSDEDLLRAGKALALVERKK